MYHRLLSSIIVLWLTGSGLYAQPLPGKWEPVRICNDCVPLAMSFIDSVYGLAVTGNSIASEPYRVFWTTDGGSSWQLRSTIPFTEFQLIQTIGFSPLLNIFSRSTAVWRVFNKIFITTDSGFTWKVTKATENNEDYIASTKYYDSATASFTYFVKRGTGGPSCIQHQRASYDMLESFSDVYSDTCIEQPLQDAFYEDSLNIWTLNGISTFLLRHSTNAGKEWQDIDLTKELKEYFVSPGPIIAGKQKDSYFILPEMLYTTDGWSTWSVDSSFPPGRFCRLAQISQNNRWAIIAQPYHPKSYSYPVYPAYLENRSPGFYPPIDTLAYTSDGGITWLRDGQTFQGQTLCEITFPDSQHGYLLSYADTGTTIYRWVADSTSKVVGDEPLSQATFISTDKGVKILPPENEPGPWRARIFDLLGRIVLREEWSSGTHEVNLDLMHGYYFLILENQKRKLTHYFFR